MSATPAANELANALGGEVGLTNNLPATNGTKENNKKRSAPDEDNADKLAARREANRIHAFKSRQRSKALLQELQRTVERLSGDKAELERENAVLRAQVEVLQQQNLALTQSQRMLLIRAGQLGAAAAAAAVAGPGQPGMGAGNAPNNGVPGPMMPPGAMPQPGAPMGNMQQQQQPTVGAGNQNNVGPAQQVPTQQPQPPADALEEATPNGNTNEEPIVPVEGVVDASVDPGQPQAAALVPTVAPTLANVPPGVPLGLPPPQPTIPQALGEDPSHI